MSIGPRLAARTILVVLVAASGAARPAGTLTLETALARTFERSPVLAVAAAERAVADARLAEARRLPDPELSIEAENVLGGGAYAGFDAAETTVAIAQSLPLARRAATVRASRAALEAAVLAATLQGAETTRELTIAYAEAIAARRMAALAAERAGAAATLRDAVQRRVAAGLDAELRLAQAETEAAAADAAASRARVEALAARRALVAFWDGEDAGEALDEAWFERIPQAGAPDEAPAPEAALRARLGEARVAAAQAGVERARAERRPDVVVTLGARRFADAPPGDERAMVLGVSMPLPLWSRNATAIAEARLELARARAEAARDLRESRDIRARAGAELDGALREVRALESVALPAARRAAELAERGFAAGRLTLSERLEAGHRLWQMRGSLERARLAAHAAQAQLAALGSTAP